MYTNHYRFRKKPFTTNPDPGFLWLGEKHKEALSALRYAILENVGFVVLTGDIGTGKTSVINYLVQRIANSANIALVTNPDMKPLDFFNFLAGEYNLTRKFNAKGDFLNHFKRFLFDARTARKKVLLIIDEAQRLDHEHLEEIRLLSNIELGNRKLLTIFLVGQSDLKNTLMAEPNRALRQRIDISYHLDTLTESETRRYIRHRLRVAGGNPQIFSTKACREVFYYSGGIPRLINSICDCALLTGYVKGSTAIEGAMVTECQLALKIPISPAQ